MQFTLPHIAAAQCINIPTEESITNDMDPLDLSDSRCAWGGDHSGPTSVH